MAKIKRKFTIAFESILILSSIFMIVLLLFLLGFVSDHVLTILQQYSELSPELQKIKTVRNTILFFVAIYITIVTVFIQWIVGRLRSINESYKIIKNGGNNNNGRRKGIKSETHDSGDGLSPSTNHGNRRSDLRKTIRHSA